MKSAKTAAKDSSNLRLSSLLRPYKLPIAVAFVAVLGETMTDILEPWPVKAVVDNVLQAKKPSGWMSEFVTRVFGDDKLATLNFVVAAVIAIAVVGAISAYFEKYMT